MSSPSAPVSESSAVPADSPAAADRSRRTGFRALLVSQFLGSFNEHALRMLILLWVESAASAAPAGWSKQKILGITGVLITLPFALFSMPAGILSDRFPKARVLLWTKLLEVAVLGLAVAAFAGGNVEILLGVFFLMALQSALYSPAKFGVLPELLDDEELSMGNGLVEMLTFTAVILGLVAPPFLRAALGGSDVAACGVLAALSAVGLGATLLIPRRPPAAPGRTLSVNPFAGLGKYMRIFREDRPLRLTTLGTVFFWSLAFLMLQNSMLYATGVLGLGEKQQAIPYVALALGIGAGSALAGILSDRKVELGLVPVGAAGMVAFSAVLHVLGARAMAHPHVFRMGWPAVGHLAAFAGLGASGGFFIVPLNALIQQRSPDTDKGGLVAAGNFFQAIGLTLSAVLFVALTDQFHLAPPALFLVIAVLCAGAAVYLFRLLPEALVRFLMWVLARLVYRIRVVGRDHIPPHGPALLVVNHVSFVDGLLVLASTHRFIRFIMDKGIAEVPVARWILGALRVIPISTTEGPKVLVNALRAAADALHQGHIVCIFAEGQITRTGQMLPFRRGIERILRDAPPGTPVIPIHLDRVWGSIFSFRGHSFVWKRPRRFPYPVTVSIGKPLPAGTPIFEIRQAVQELGSDAFVHRHEDLDPLHRAFVKTARRMWTRPATADSTGAGRTFGEMLVASVILARRLRERELLPGGRGVPASAPLELRRGSPEREARRRHTPTAGASGIGAASVETSAPKGPSHAALPDMVGLLLPPTVAAAAANAAVLLSGRVPVNLNYTTSAESLRSCVAQCGIRTIVTSRAFLERVKIEPPAPAVFLEDLAGEPTLGEKLGAWLAARGYSADALEEYAGRTGPPAAVEDVATIIFSSGSTGEPKGVMLTHANILSNIEGFTQVYDPQPEDGFLGVLPFFHSFGFTATLWFPLIEGVRVVYHVNPADARTVGDLVRRHGLTYLLATPTFLQAYTRRCDPGDFGSLRNVIVGAEKLTDRVADAFKEKFGLEPYEGYGCTECAPIVAVNAPDFRARGFRQVAAKRGRIGHPIPGVTVRVVDPETLRPLPPGTEGMLLVKGPNVMKGYLGRPEKTAEVIRDGWYVTGDVAKMEEDGFVMITDRLSRFSKIGGEMVPHVKVEEALHEALGAVERVLVVTGVPDEKKGERLAVVHALPEDKVRELAAKLPTLGLPNLWLPRLDSFHRIDAIPLLGSGKTDLKKVKELALRLEGGGGGEP